LNESSTEFEFLDELRIPYGAACFYRRDALGPGPDPPGQGTVIFANNPSSGVTNLVTLGPVPAGTTFKAALYCAADGVLDESQFVQIGPAVGFFAPGLFFGGARTSIPAIPPGGWGMFQVRVFEAAFGATYEEVSCRGLVAESSIVRLQTGGPLLTPPANLATVLPSFFIAPLGPIPRIEISVSDASVTEGDAGTKTIEFHVSATSINLGSGEVSVDFHTSPGTALPGEDYVSTNGTLTIGVFPGFGGSAELPVLVRGDPIFEPDETFSLVLSNPSCPAVLSGGTATGTIRNDDCRARLAIGLYAGHAGLTIQGCVGKTYRVEAADAVEGPYTAVTNLVLNSSPYLWMDPASSLRPQRFYRTALLP
jgi:hypothetical protein